MKEGKQENLPWILLFFGITCISISAYFVKKAHVNGISVSFYRMFFATLIILPFYIRIKSKLTASVTQMARERKEFPITYQVLINTMFDLLGLTKPLSRVENAKGYRLETHAIEGWYVPKYLNDLSEAKNPLASPLLAENFKDLPDACIITCEYDPLRDEGEHYAKNLSEAGADVCLKRYDGIIHGFFNMQGTVKEARDSLDLVCIKLNEALHPVK